MKMQKVMVINAFGKKFQGELLVAFHATETETHWAKVLVELVDDRDWMPTAYLICYCAGKGDILQERHQAIFATREEALASVAG